MTQTNAILKGTVHGKTIELEIESGLPDGQRVNIVLKPSLPASNSLGEGIRQSAGGWADDPEGLEEFLAWNRQRRKAGRPEIDP